MNGEQPPCPDGSHCLAHGHGLALVAAAAITRPAFVIAQVLVVGVAEGHAGQAPGLGHVPAHEVHGVGKIVPADEPGAGFALVVGPGVVLGLGIAVGRGYPAPRDDAQEVIARRPGFERVLEGIDQALELLPPGSVKLNSVVMRNMNEMEIPDFVEMTSKLVTCILDLPNPTRVL